MIAVDYYYGNLKDSENKASKSYIQVNSVGIEMRRSEGIVIRENGRCDYHILYISDGNVEVFYQNNLYMLKSGEFIIYPPNEPQKYIRKAGSKTYWIHFNGFQAKEILNDCHLEYGVNRHGGYNRTAIENLFTRLVTVHPIKDEFSYENGVLIMLLYELGKSGNTAQIRQIEDCIAYLNKNYNFDVRNETLAELCHISKSRFLALFKRYTGTSPQAYIAQLRIETARHILKHTDLSVKEVAETVGYSDPLYFSRVFKKHTGISPKSYKLASKNTPGI